MRYLVTYEIDRHPDYPPLIAVLRSLRVTRVLTAAWVVESDRPAYDVCRHVIAAGCLSANEPVLVVEIGPDVAWRRLGVADDAVPRVFGAEGPPPGD